MTRSSLIALAVTLCISALPAQNYQVNWSVVDIGGGTMSSASYQTASSVGQTAAGFATSTNYQSFIGFWQIDTAQVGIKDEIQWNASEPLSTRLYAPFPNPCPSGRSPAIRYSLATEDRVSICLFDLTGRNVNTLINATQKPGKYSTFVPAHASSSSSYLSSGVYFLKMTAGDYRSTTKLVLE
jgi:hypothetical protein